MKKLTLSLLTMATLTLTACGGGDDSPVASQPTPSVSPSANPSANPNTQTPAVASNATYTGQVIKIDDNDRIATSNIGTNDINQLVVGNKSYTVGYAGINAGSFTNLKTAAYHNVASGSHMSYAKYGYYDDEQADSDYLYYQGQKTPVSAIPTTGSAVYTGRSLYVCDDCNEDVVIGTSSFNVNFANKTLTGAINNTIANITLNANIAGNGFVGTTNDGTTTTGAFFGSNAQELSGVYHNNVREFAGAFGAKR